MSERGGTETVSKSSGGDNVSVKLAAKVYRKLRTVASWKDEGISEYLSRIVEPIVDRELDKMTREINQDRSPSAD